MVCAKALWLEAVSECRKPRGGWSEKKLVGAKHAKHWLLCSSQSFSKWVSAHAAWLYVRSSLWSTPSQLFKLLERAKLTWQLLYTERSPSRGVQDSKM